MALSYKGGATATKSSEASVEAGAYTRWYCEENIHQLLSRFVSKQERRAGRLWAVFLSNPSAQLPLWGQKSGDVQHSGFICYDYHVIAIETFPDQETLVYDFDSVLPFPSNWSTYSAATIKTLPPHLAGQYSRLFRVIDAIEFVDTFASDRSHMMEIDGTWKAPPPTHPCIIAKDGASMNLRAFITMGASCQEESTPVHGQVMDEEAFRQLCTGSSSCLSG